MHKHKCLIIILLLVFGTVYCQNEVLDAYIKEGLASNLALQQKKLDYQKSLLALREAKGMFYPDVSLKARYTVAEGGRIITFPIGDLLNPVYSTLNLLTMTEQFPTVDNEEFPFYRPREQETKLSLVQPIYNSQLIGNVKVKKEYSELMYTSVDMYKRELIREIKTAYYNYQNAHYMNRIIDTTFTLVNENLRLSQRLFNNSVVTRDVVYRSESEISKVEVEKANAQKMLNVSRAYFNFLLNRQLEEPIELKLEDPPPFVSTLEDAKLLALENREELQLISKTLNMNSRQLNIQKGSNIPSLFGVVDYGFQGEEYQFTSDDDFILASLVLQWNIFHGMTEKNSRSQTRIEGEKLREALSEAEQKIQMQVITSYYTVLSAYKSIASAKKQLTSSRKAYYMIERKYEEGQANLLEFIDARTSFTTSYSGYFIALNQYLISLAEFESATASADLTKF
ncbi:TolC family protein [Bacteroidota bacterium]